jgi:hypothetical protein
MVDDIKMGPKNRMGVNWINAHAAPSVCWQCFTLQETEDGYWEFHGEALH